MKHKSLLSLSATISTVLLLAQPYPTQSQGVTFGIAPENPEASYFEFTLNPGESISDAVVAKNFSNQKIFLQVSLVDGKTATNGGISYDFENTGGTSQWIQTAAGPIYEMRPFATQRIPFTVTVPQGTPPGEYVAGFLAAPAPATPAPVADQNDTTNNYIVNVVTRVAVAVIIRVPGQEHCDMTLKRLDATVFGAQWRYAMVFSNTGNVHFKGSASITVREKESKNLVAQKDYQVGYVVPNSEMNSNINFEIPEPGTYTYQILLTDKDRPACHFTFEGETSYGEQEEALLATQATVLAYYHRTPTPTPIVITATPGVIQGMKTPGTTGWYVWISVVVLFISAGLVIYALSILKKNKK